MILSSEENMVTDGETNNSQFTTSEPVLMNVIACELEEVQFSSRINRTHHEKQIQALGENVHTILPTRKLQRELSLQERQEKEADLIRERGLRIESQESKDKRFEEFQLQKKYKKHNQDKNVVEVTQSRSNTTKVHFKEHIQVIYENINTN